MTLCFNSRTLGCDSISVQNSVSRRPFQFTHPGKGATGDPCLHGGIEDVSIHAPWEGCDMLRIVTTTYIVEFQFTHPGKGATG